MIISELILKTLKKTWKGKKSIISLKSKNSDVPTIIKDFTFH